jgi:hypothetical protein
LSFHRLGLDPRFLLASAAVAVAVACTPEIGDKCNASTDCSTRGDRLCDTSQPGGYCTVLNCRGGSCADDAVCVLFGSAVPGCGYDDRSGTFGSRVARSFCMAQCESNADCREGYVCESPRVFPWNAVILENDQGRRACLPRPLEGLDAGAPPSGALVCGPAAPALTPIDAGPPRIHDAGAPPPPLFPDAGDGRR